MMTTRYRLPVLLALTLAFCCFEFAYGQEEATLEPSKDNTLYESSDGSLSNGQGVHLFAGRTNQAQGSIRRALIAFDVAGAVPAGATVDSVMLTLNMNKTTAGAQAVALHRVTADWGEGTSDAGGNQDGGGAASTTGDATWLHTFFNTDQWSSAGGDFAAGASATTSVDGNGDYTWGSTAEMVADVQDWLDTPEENFGWILIGNEGSARTAKQFDSREGSNPPTLRIFYSMATAVEDDEVPEAVRLAQNYPNPFTQATTITYTLAAPQQVTLEVFDAQGRRVARLVDARQGAGPHEAVFNARGLPGGIYLYRLTTERAIQYRTMTVLR